MVNGEITDAKGHLKEKLRNILLTLINIAISIERKKKTQKYRFIVCRKNIELPLAFEKALLLILWLLQLYVYICCIYFGEIVVGVLFA